MTVNRSVSTSQPAKPPFTDAHNAASLAVPKTKCTVAIPLVPVSVAGKDVLLYSHITSTLAKGSSVLAETTKA
ncbi:hypothetical protein D3C74_456640 [compost metagenome]